MQVGAAVDGLVLAHLLEQEGLVVAVQLQQQPTQTEIMELLTLGEVVQRQLEAQAVELEQAVPAALVL
jgi:NAD(P)H-hydrate repair Nnr-like enzyme with NAD(P)H-hydrate epimerase domain